MSKSKKTKIIAVQGTNNAILDAYLLYNCMRNRNRVEYFSTREKTHHPDFNYGEFTAIKGVEFDTFNNA